MAKKNQKKSPDRGVDKPPPWVNPPQILPKVETPPLHDGDGSYCKLCGFFIEASLSYLKLCPNCGTDFEESEKWKRSTDFQKENKRK